MTCCESHIMTTLRGRARRPFRQDRHQIPARPHALSSPLQDNQPTMCSGWGAPPTTIACPRQLIAASSTSLCPSEPHPSGRPWLLHELWSHLVQSDARSTRPLDTRSTTHHRCTPSVHTYCISCPTLQLHCSTAAADSSTICRFVLSS